MNHTPELLNIPMIGRLYFPWKEETELRRFVYHLRNKGELTFHKCGRELVVRRADLEAYLERCVVVRGPDSEETAA